MPTSLQPDVEQKILKARIALTLRQPFLASAIMRLPIKDASHCSWCKTMATDGYHIFFNAEWVSTLNQHELRGVLAHEVLHVLFQHSSRRSSREPTIWNIACDHAINLLLLEQGFSLPKAGFADARYAGLPSEEIYSRLPKSLNYLKAWTTSSQVNSAGDENTGAIPNIGTDILDPDFLGSVGLRDSDFPDVSQLDALCQELRNEAKSKLQGKAAGYFSSECQAIDDAKIDWRDVLRAWMFDRIKTDWSLWPYSKKHIHRGFFMPSVGIEAPGHLIFAIDTSGSMSDDEIADIFTEIRIYRETFPCKLTVIQADADIQKIIEYEELDGEEIPARIQIVGRGGTNFIPVFDWITTHAPSANLIYATDGFGTFPSFTISFSVIWLLTANAIDPASLPFGTCIKLTTRR